MRNRWKKLRFIAMLLCCVLLVNMNTGALVSHATGTDGEGVNVIDDVSEGDVSEGDVTEGDISDGNVSEGDMSDEDIPPATPNKDKVNVRFSGNGGVFKAVDKTATDPFAGPHGGWGTYVDRGAVIGDTVSMGDITWDNGERTLMGWIVGYETMGEDSSEYTRLDEKLYQLADMMNYVVPADYAHDNLVFKAQWNSSENSSENPGGMKPCKFILNSNGGYLIIDGTDGTTVKPPMITYNTDAETLNKAMVQKGHTYLHAERDGYEFAGWELYSYEDAKVVNVPVGTTPEVEEGYVSELLCTMRFSDGSEDVYVLLKGKALVTESIPTEYLLTENAEKGFYACAIWEKDAPDYNAPVFEGLEVSYDAENNKILFDVKAYDADSNTWYISLSFTDEKGQNHWVYENGIQTNPYKFEYEADKLANGTYWVRYINIYDKSGNRVEQNFWDDTYKFNITNSPYVCPFVIKDVIPSKDKVQVSKEKSETITVTLEMEKGQEALVKDPNNNNRVGYMAYMNSGYFDLYQGADGKITGTYTIDWVYPNETDYVHRIYLCSYANEDESTYEPFEYDYDNHMGDVSVTNTTTWKGDMNMGPFRVTELTVTDMSTNQPLVNGTFFDVSDEKNYRLSFSLTIDEVLPEDTRLELIMVPSVSNYSNKWVPLQRQADGKTYTGETLISRTMGCTEFSVAAVALARGDVSHWHYLNYNKQPYFNVKSDGNFVTNAKKLTVSLYSYAGSSPELLLQKEVSMEERPTLTIEDIVGGEAAYAELVAKTKRDDGSVCDGWVDEIYATGSSGYYGPKDTVNLYHNQSFLTLWTTYPENEVGVRFEYFDENGQWIRDVVDPITVEKGTTAKEVVELLRAEGKVPTPPAKGDYQFVDWDLSGYANGLQEFSHNWHITIEAGYTVPTYHVYAEQYTTAGKYEYVSTAMLFEKDATVKDLIAKLGTPYVPAGDTFLRWAFSNKCWYGGQAIDWEDDMLLYEYGCPSFYAVYQSMLDDDDDDDDDDDAQATPTPTPTVAPTAKPVVKPNITPVEPTVTTAPAETAKPAIVTPPGVALSEEKVTEKVEQITQALEALKAPEANATNEKPVIVLDMKTENNEPATMVPVEVLEVIKGQDVDVVLDMGGYSWTVNGADIKATELASINLEVKVDADAIPSKLVDTLAGGAPATQLSLTHNGDFGFKASLTVNLGAENAGQFGNMYYYDSDNRLVFMNAGKIDEQGNVALSFSHASDYVVIVGEEVVADEGTVYVESDGNLVASSKEEVTAEKPEKSETAADLTVVVGDTVEDGNNSAVIIIIVLLVIALAAIVIVLFLKKNKNA